MQSHIEQTLQELRSLQVALASNDLSKYQDESHRTLAQYAVEDAVMAVEALRRLQEAIKAVHGISDYE